MNRTQIVNAQLHLENQIVQRMNFLRQNNSAEIEREAKEVKETLAPTVPVVKINLTKGPVYKVKNPHLLVNLDEELDGEEYYLAQAANVGHVEIPAT